jgi:dipeptidyl aminopeptidase/acylaminoacyl peptidase
MTQANSAASSDLGKPHPFSVQDMVRMERVGDPKPAPDGQWIVFTRRTWDPEANKVTTNLWLVSPDGAMLRPLTSARHQSDSSPTWSPDGRTIAFASGRSGSQQIWTIPRDGGEPQQLTKLPVDVDNLRWSPTGEYIAFTAEVYTELADLEATAQRDKRREADPVKAMKFDRLFIRHWDTWMTGKRLHLFVLPVQRRGAAPGEWTAGTPVDLMKGLDSDAPPRPFGGAEEFGWSPDGRELAYAARALTGDAAWSTNINIHVVPVTGGPARCITAENSATDSQPVYSPDGRMIAYLAMTRPGFESDRNRVRIYERESGRTRTLTEAWDRSPGSLCWTPDSRTLLVTAEEHARQKVFAVDLSKGEPRELIGAHYNAALALLPAGSGAAERFVFAQDSFASPVELYSARLDGSDARRLTKINDERVRLAQMAEPDEFWFKGALDEKVHAWIFKPVGFQAGGKYPVAFVIHGGPQGAVEDHFHYRWNPQALAGAGYAVLAVNFHGSTGYGQAFTDSISGDWGGKPFQDLMKGLDHALATYPWLDGDRVAALGASYGGWMINWINGHTNRFKCLVNHDGGFDEFANYYTTEELWFPEWEFKGVPWKNPELFDRFSPSRYVAHWQTPTLVIHGAKDYRLIDAEGIATFTALQRKGIPSQLLYFPDENHWVLKAKNSILWHDTILAWLDRWLKK